MNDYYSVLGVARDAPPEVIRAAYRVLIQSHHPDRAVDARSAAKGASINEAYRVLSNSVERAAYDRVGRGLSADAVAPTVRTRPPVRVAAVNHEVELRFIAGTVLSSNVWTEEKTTSRGGGGVTFAGFGYSRRVQVTSRSTTKQRIAIRGAAGADLFVDHLGPPLPVAPGQFVELVQLITDGARSNPYVSLINQSIGQWFWMSSQVDSGALVRTTSALLLDVMAYLGFVAAAAFVVWLLFVRDGSFLVGAAFVVLGVPALLGGATPLLFRTANKIGAAIRAAIATAAGTAL